MFKLISLLSIWFVGFVGGVMPFFIRQRNPVLMSQLNCMSGGVFLAGGFMHLLHAAIENPGLSRWSTMDEGVYAFPYAEMFCTIGFLGVLIIEQCAHALQFKALPSQHEHSRESTATADNDYDDTPDSAPFLEQVEVRLPSIMKNRKKSDHHDLMPFDKYDRPSRHSLDSTLCSHASGTVALVLFAALSFHSILEGLGIGAQSTPAWGVFLAIIIHKGLAAFALGSGMLKSQVNKATFVAYMFLFSMMSIIGIIVGWCISSASESSEDVRIVFVFI